MAAIAHPNVLAVHDMGSQEGRDYIVMSLAERSLLDACWSSPQPIQIALAWTIQVLSALSAAHDTGIVHRDIKPENVLLDSRGNALLADLGIALLRQGERHTHTGAAMGSLAFMAPEQRLDARTVGPAADLYATGCMLFNLVTGSNPFDLFTADADSKRLAGMPRCLRYPILKATRYQVSERFVSARAMASALMGVAELLLEEESLTTSMDQEQAATYVDTLPAREHLGPDFVLLPSDVDEVPVAPFRDDGVSPIPPLHPNEAVRMQALLELALLDSPREERFERHTRLAQHLFDVPIAVVSLVADERQWFKSHRGLDATETGRDVSFCGHAILEPEQLTVVADALLDARFRNNPLVLGDPRIRFYAGCPIRSDTGEPLGTLCVIDRRPRTMDPPERALLHDLAKMVESELRSSERASIDPEAGVSNLLGFKRLANRVLAFANAEGRSITLVRIQLQSLRTRSTNDASFSSAPLKSFAGLLEPAFSGALVLARVDPRSFAILLPGAPDVQSMGLTLRALIDGTTDLQVEMRLGSAAYDGSRAHTLAGIMGRADPDMPRDSA